jgi:hypothetical protein
MLAPEVNPEHAKKIASFLRTLDDAELSQAIATPRALVNRLEGFTMHHLQTTAETAVIQLAKDEQTRRRDSDVGKHARHALIVSIVAVIFAALALAVAFCAWRFPNK